MTGPDFAGPVFLLRGLVTPELNGGWAVESRIGQWGNSTWITHKIDQIGLVEVLYEKCYFKVLIKAKELISCCEFMIISSLS